MVLVFWGYGLSGKLLLVFTRHLYFTYQKHGTQDEKIKESAETIKELQEHIIQITRITEVEKEKYRQ